MPVVVAAVIDREGIVSLSRLMEREGGFNLIERERGGVINEFNLGFLSHY